MNDCAKPGSPSTFQVTNFQGHGIVSLPSRPILEDPLGKRAWACQEWLLAGRVLHCGGEELFWECRSTICCECESLSLHNRPSLRQKLDRLRAANGVLVRSDLTDLWSRVVGTFARGDLTVHTDRLPALSGVASLFNTLEARHSLLGEYTAGLWSATLPLSLLWRAISSTYRPPSYVAPSWSWASVSGGVDYSTNENGHLEPSCTVDGIHCDLASEDPYGQVLYGYIQLSSQVFETSVRRCQEDYWRAGSWEKGLWMATASLKSSVLCHPDHTPRDEEHEQSSTIPVVFLIVGRYPHLQDFACLILRRCPKKDDNNSYERFGATTLSTRHVTKTERRTLTII